MSKLSISIGDKAYRLWVRIDSTKPFSDDVIALVRKIKTNKKTSGHVRTLTETRIICTPPVFDRIQTLTSWERVVRLFLVNSCQTVNQSS